MVHSSVRLSSVIISVALLFPLFPTILPGTSGFQLISLMLVVLCTYGLLKKASLPRLTVLSAIALLSVILILSIQGSLLDTIGGVFVKSDLFEIPKYISIFLVFLYFSSLNQTDSSLKGLMSTLFCVSMIIIVYSYFEVFVDIFKKVAFFLYKREGKEIIGNKAVGPFGITYHLAYFLLLPTFWFLSSSMTSCRIRSWLCFLLSFGAILLTQSRTMFLTTFLGFLLVPFLYHIEKTKVIKWYVVLLVSFIPFAATLIYFFWDSIIVLFSYTYAGLSLLFEKGLDFSGQGKGSANIRLAQMLWAVNNQFTIPVISAGIGKGEMVLESLYALYYYRFGVWGILFFGFVLFLSNSTANFLLKYDDKSFSGFYYGMKLFYVLSPIALISSASQDSTRLMIIFYGMLGVMLSRKRYILSVNYNKTET